MTSTGTILITGGNGQTSGHIAKILSSKGYPFLVASRKGQEGVPSPFKGVKFDWTDKSTWDNAFNAANNIRAIYLLSPPGHSNSFSFVKEFIDLAKEKGVKRFVLLSGATAERRAPGTDGEGPGTGVIHDYIASIGVEWAVLRPTWFTENFSNLYLKSIKEENIIPSATADGKMAFISTQDIARIAVDALVDEKSHDREHYIVGPELLSYDEVAEIFTEVLGRKITHKQYTEEQRVKDFVSMGIPEPIAKWLSAQEAKVAKGLDEKAFKQEGVDYGVDTVKEYILANQNLWK